MTQYIILPKQAKDITGQRFGRLVALGPIGKTPSTQIKWHCQCDCGNTVDVVSQSLREGITLSCGCLRRENFTRRKTIHGLAGHPVYRTWKGIVTRCTNPNTIGYENYGGRGITICDEWRHDFVLFFEHVSKLPHYGEDGYSIDRLNNSLGYFAGNVRWATPTEQNRNSRHNRNLAYNGKTQTMTEWASEFGLKFATLDGRLRRGWDMERALHVPTRKGE